LTPETMVLSERRGSSGFRNVEASPFMMVLNPRGS
jgi:hypothetical protein